MCGNGGVAGAGLLLQLGDAVGQRVELLRVRRGALAERVDLAVALERCALHVGDALRVAPVQPQSADAGDEGAAGQQQAAPVAGFADGAF